MKLFARVAIAAAAVVAVALVWYNLGPSRSDVGGVTPPSPSIAPSPAPSPVPISQGDSNPGRPLQAGIRYGSADPFPVPLSFVAPTGWAANIGGPYAIWAGPALTGDSVGFQRSPTVYHDPCHPESGTVPMAAKASDLVNSIKGLPGLAAITPTSTTLGGQPATTFRLALATGTSVAGCSNATYTVWQLPLGATEELQPGSSETVWVLDTSKGPLVVTASGNGAAADQQAIQQVLDSMDITP